MMKNNLLENIVIVIIVIIAISVIKSLSFSDQPNLEMYKNTLLTVYFANNNDEFTIHRCETWSCYVKREGGIHFVKWLKVLTNPHNISINNNLMLMREHLYKEYVQTVNTNRTSLAEWFVKHLDVLED